MRLAFTQAVGQSRGDNVFLVHGGGDTTGHAAWYFVRVEAAKIRAFLKAIAQGSIALELYGSIVESGYGKEPPQAVIDHMRANHGYTG